MTRRSLLDHFADLPDPRVDLTKKHRLDGLPLIALTAVRCRATTFEDIADFGEAYEDFFRPFLAFEHGLPSHARSTASAARHRRPGQPRTRTQRQEYRDHALLPHEPEGEGEDDRPPRLPALGHRERTPLVPRRHPRRRRQPHRRQERRLKPRHPAPHRRRPPETRPRRTQPPPQGLPHVPQSRIPARTATRKNRELDALARA